MESDIRDYCCICNKPITADDCKKMGCDINCRDFSDWDEHFLEEHPYLLDFNNYCRCPMCEENLK